MAMAVRSLDKPIHWASVDLLFYIPPIVCGGSVLVFVLLYDPSSFAIILTRESWLLCFYCLLNVLLL